MPAHLPARPRCLRRQEGLRRRRLRRMHGLARRHPGAFLPDARLPRRRPRDHDHRGARARARPASDAASLSRRTGVPVRLLRRRHDHDGRLAWTSTSAPICRMRSRAICAAAPATARSPMRSSGVTTIEEDIAGKACGASLPNPFSEAIVTGRARYTMDVAIDRLLHLKVLRSPHAHARILHIGQRAGACRSGRGRDLHLGGRAAPALQHGDPRRPPRRSRRHLRARQRRALRRPARRRGRRRNRGRGRKGLPAARRHVRDPAGGVRSGGRDGSRTHRCCTTRAAPREATSSSTSTARSAAWRTASRPPTPCTR